MAIRNRKKTAKQILASATDNRPFLQNPNIVDPKHRRDVYNTAKKTPLMEKYVYMTIDWMREGKSIEWITSTLKQEKNERTERKLAPRFVENIITASNQLLTLWYHDQIYNVEKIHIARYNQIIIDKLNKKYNFNEGMPEWLCTKIICDDLMDVLQAMKQKETLLGMHRKSFKITINNQTNVVVNKDNKVQQGKIDIHNLTFDEQVELLQLIEITNRSEDELHGVILRDKKKEIEAEEIEVEALPANVESMEILHNNSNQHNTGSTLSEIEKKIQERLVLKAKQ